MAERRDDKEQEKEASCSEKQKEWELYLAREDEKERRIEWAKRKYPELFRQGMSLHKQIECYALGYVEMAIRGQY